MSFIIGLIVSVFFIALPVNAAILYVDNTQSCPGNGSSSTPYCSIQNAMNNVNAGDNIRIRTGTGVYNETASISGKNGTLANPIIMEPDTGANFIIRNTAVGTVNPSIQIKESDYWTVRNLTFNAAGVNPSYYALKLQCETKNCVGIIISGNTFKNWTQQPAASFGPNVLTFAGASTALGSSANRTITGIIENNTFQNNDHVAIQLMKTANTIVRNNTITGMRCGRGTDNAANNVGIHEIFGSTGLRFYGNQISDFVPVASCPLSNGFYMTTAAYWCDVGNELLDSDMQIYNNTIFNLDQGNTSGSGVGGALGHYSQGLFIEAGCSGFSSFNNVIYNIGNAAITNSLHYLDAKASPNFYHNNTIYNVGEGFCIKEGVLVVKNNIVKNASGAAMKLDCTSGSAALVSLTSNYNLYDAGASQTNIGSKGGSNYNLTDWRTQCSCDANSVTANPLFVSMTIPDLHIQSGSPARGSGESGVDIGAYPYTGSVGSVPTAPNNLQIKILP